MYSDAFPAVSPYAAGKLKFLFCEGKDKQTNVIAKKTAGKASVKDGNATMHGTFNKFRKMWIVILNFILLPRIHCPNPIMVLVFEEV